MHVYYLTCYFLLALVLVLFVCNFTSSWTFKTKVNLQHGCITYFTSEQITYSTCTKIIKFYFSIICTYLYIFYVYSIFIFNIIFVLYSTSVTVSRPFCCNIRSFCSTYIEECCSFSFHICCFHRDEFDDRIWKQVQPVLSYRQSQFSVEYIFISDQNLWAQRCRCSKQNGADIICINGSFTIHNRTNEQPSERTSERASQHL